MWWSNASKQERYFNSLDIRDWADGILSDPDVSVDVSTRASIQQYAAWSTGGNNVDCELWRIDDYRFDGGIPRTRYNFAIHNKQYGSRYYQLDPDQTDPYACSADWDILKTQFRIIARDDMLTYLRTSPVDATTMLTRKEVDKSFDNIVRRFGQSDKRRLRRIAENGVGGTALDTLRQMFDRNNDT